ncbi:response regulator transcription factor [Sutterella wadsworthensis]|uniref:response regulator transcription factor n=1 Tax=Sutterella wadsworthensis TaxID=40545 RepID=UPI00242C28CA|nr:response regulator transcription factor [Sutterella wadsworthensis]
MSNELLDPRLPPLVRIVDDDDRVRQSEAFVLRLEGFDVREYSSAEDFLHFDDVSRAGCIVLDIRMPGMNGLELQSELLRTGRSLPILFLTGHGDVAMAVDALKRGAADFIQKPVKAERLAALTHELVAWHQQYTQRLTQRRHAIEKLKALTPKAQGIGSLPLSCFRALE